MDLLKAIRLARDIARRDKVLSVTHVVSLGTPSFSVYFLLFFAISPQQQRSLPTRG